MKIKVNFFPPLSLTYSRAYLVCISSLYMRTIHSIVIFIASNNDEITALFIFIVNGVENVIHGIK